MENKHGDHTAAGQLAGMCGGKKVMGRIKNTWHPVRGEGMKQHLRRPTAQRCLPVLSCSWSSHTWRGRFRYGAVIFASQRSTSQRETHRSQRNSLGFNQRGIIYSSLCNHCKSRSATKHNEWPVITEEGVSGGTPGGSSKETMEKKNQPTDRVIYICFLKF